MKIQICTCNHCTSIRKEIIAARNEEMHKITLQQEFESVCFMYEHIEIELKVAVDKFNQGKPLNNTQKQMLVKAIWRN